MATNSPELAGRGRWNRHVGVAGVAVLLITLLPAPAAAGEVDSDDEESSEQEAVQLEGVEVTTTGREVSLSDVYRPTTIMEGDELQRNLDSSVPATLQAVPGFDFEYNGPGAARPTMRGLPGNRVLMLEDGHRTGDIYWTASDHGVMVEPLSAQRMEVVRGPAGLLYGSNALGGVVNVVRNDVPIRQFDELEGAAGAQLESVNRGGGAAAVVRGPMGPVNFYGEATGRAAGDERTPAGTIEQTDMRVFNGAFGLSWLPDWGVVGAAARYYDSLYGVPGQFDGEMIPGGHPGGVDIDTTRMSSRLLARHEQPPGPVEDLELRANITRYIHDEIEGIVGDDEVLGARFDQWTTDSRLTARHSAIEGDDDDWALHGAAGLSVQTRDLDAGGASPGTRSGIERDIGVFAFEELELEPLRFQLSGRYDFRHVTTGDLSVLRTRTEERTIEKQPRQRNLGAFSGSLSSLYAIDEDWTVGASLARSFRHPTIEELYSDGPHLADFSYDIGDPELDTEIGYGADLFVRADHDRLELEIAGFYNRISNYIHYNPTGETMRVFREGTPPRVTPVFEAQGDDALFVGGEGRVQWEFVDDLFIDITASYTRATRLADDDPLPFIPPLSGTAELRYDGESFFGSAGADLSAAQNRVPRPVQIGDSQQTLQEPTDGYALAHVMIGWRHVSAANAHTVMVRADNITDRLWRDHTSQISSIAPQPGRNIQLSYRADF